MSARLRPAVVAIAAGALLVTGAGTLAVAHEGGDRAGTSDVTFHEGASALDRLRFATAPYFEIDEAVEDGHGELQDAEGIACIESSDPATGTMGIHYVNGTLVGDSEVRLRRPEALIYEPQEDGDMELVAVEYVVFKSAWREEHPTGRPKLLGQRFSFVNEPNRYGIPAFFELHVWAWRENPSGLFADYNPDVTCDHAPAP